jgi:hypothetical protein
MSAWEATALSSMMILMVPELTCYYYSFLVVVALLYEKRKEVGMTLLAVTAATGFIDWAPTQFLPKWVPQMPTWLDQQYTYMSVATLVGFVYILYEFGFIARTETETSPAAPEPASAPAGGGTAPAPKGRGKSSGRRKR